MIGPKKTFTVQRSTIAASTTSAGGTVTWSDLGKIKGVLVPRDTKEILDIDKPTVFAVNYLWTDYPKYASYTITEKDRIVLQTKTKLRIFNIVNIRNPGETDTYLQFTLKEAY